MKGLHSPHGEYGIRNLCCYPAKIVVMESVCSTCQLAGLLQAALELTMKNTDIFNIKPASCLVLLLLFKLGFVEYLKNVYTYIY